MTELDFSRDAIPHRRGQKRFYEPSEEDTFLRTTLLPQIWKLEDTERAELDEHIVSKYEPDVDGPMRHVAGIVLRRLSVDELCRISNELS